MAEENNQSQQQPTNPVQPVGHQYMLSRKDPTLVMKMVVDDTPKMMKDELPEYFNDETALTHFDDKDRKIEMCYHTISMLSKLKEVKVRDFDAMKFRDIEKKTVWAGKCTGCGFNTFDRNTTVCPGCSMKGTLAEMKWSGVEIQEITNELNWGGMFHRTRPKVFVKTTRAKGGFTFRGLTEEKSSITQELRQPVMQGPAPEPKKKRFSLF